MLAIETRAGCVVTWRVDEEDPTDCMRSRQEASCV